MNEGRSGSKRRPGRREIGQRAEDAALDYLQGLGLEVLGRNVRVGHLEVDLLVREGPVVAVVEVRTRGEGAWVGPFASVDARKRRRLIAAGRALWRTRLARDPTIARLRFDVVAVHFDPEGPPRVEHARAAFTTTSD